MSNNSSVTRRVSITLVLLLLLASIMMLGLTAQNEGCLPWQERVGYGDGPLGDNPDYSTCR
jgi:hypothetical protein